MSVTVMLEKDEKLAARVEAVRELLEMFRVERAIYVSVSALSIAILLTAAIALVLAGAASTAVIASLFGATGAVTFTTSRLLRMWSEALKVLGPLTKE